MGFGDFVSKIDDFVMMPGAGEVIGDFTGENASRRNRQAAQESRDLQLSIMRENNALQREFAQHGIRWRVADAKAAGLHPLAALGAAGSSFSPSIPMIDPLPDAKSWRDEMGQNVRGFMMSRLDPHQRALASLSVERGGLENQLLRLQILNELKGQKGGTDPYLTGQGDSAAGSASVIDVPLKRVVSDPQDPSKEAGAIQDWQIVRTKDGYAVVPAQGVKQAIEDSPMEYQWLIRAARRTYTLPDGRPARMNPLTGELKPIRRQGFWREVQDKFMEGPFGILSSR